MWIANSFVIAATIALFLLWFRYVCSLLLAAQTSLDSSESVARANSLAFADVLRELASGAALSPAQMDALALSLASDFEVVTYLLRNMGARPRTTASGETWMLRLDYRTQALSYRVMRHVSAAQARAELTQMAIIICHFADLIGERSVAARG